MLQFYQMIMLEYPQLHTQKLLGLTIKILAFIWCLLLAYSGHFGFLVVSEQIDMDSFNVVRGPNGALFVLFALVVILFQFIRFLIKRNDKLRDKVESLLEEKADFFKKEAEEAKRKNS